MQPGCARIGKQARVVIAKTNDIGKARGERLPQLLPLGFTPGVVTLIRRIEVSVMSANSHGDNARREYPILASAVPNPTTLPKALRGEILARGLPEIRVRFCAAAPPDADRRS